MTQPWPPSAEVRSYLSEPDRGQRCWHDTPKAQQVVYCNRRRIRDERGKELLRRRGELRERSFAHAYELEGYDACMYAGETMSSSGC